MSEGNSLKKGIAGLLSATVLAMAFVMYISADTNPPTLGCQGFELRTMADGSVQMQVTVYVDQLENSSGAAFYLDYNQTYLTPSNQTTNAPIVNTGLTADETFFAPDKELYTPASGAWENPFEPSISVAGQSHDYCRVDTQAGYIAMDLKVKQSLSGGKLKQVQVSPKEAATVFDASAAPVTLGTLSFRVEPEYLPRIVELFDGITENESPTKNGEFLIQFRAKETAVEPWQISAYEPTPNSHYHNLVSFTKDSTDGHRGRGIFTFRVPQTVISVEAAERDVVVDAYQAYHEGTDKDLSNLLRKYSPMVTATYADGSRVNYIMPWGLEDDTTANLNYGYTPYRYNGSTPDHLGAQITAYDPTGNVAVGETPDYIVQQYFYYQTGVDDSGAPVYKRHPVPITATVAVTPITLTGVSCEDQERSYGLTPALLSNVNTISDLKLPTRARLSTDITPDGASLMMDIPGWKSANAVSSWPEGTLNTLIADGETDVHWPTTDDSGKLEEVKAKRLGDYSFVMSSTMGGTAEEKFSATEIKAAYPWLTVPGDWDGGLTVVRKLQDATVYTDAAGYPIQHLSTSTDNTNGQPVLKIQAAKGNGQPEANLSAATKFRVRLPDGTQLDESWFVPASGGTSYANSVWATEPISGLGTMGVAGMNVILQPGDLNATDAYAEQRELLRRYINLGGWFHVSLREDADHEWSDFIPVYVPPRANAYTQNAEYYFIGDNRGLYDYPGTLGATVILPRGEFVPLASDGTYLYKNENNKPIYVRADGIETVDPETGGVKNRLKADRYGVTTTYDGTTGRDGGRLYTFSVEAWNNKTNSLSAIIHGKTYSDITQYGPDALKSPATYAAYGEVLNVDGRTAAMRFHEPDTTPAQTGEQVSLTGVGTGLSTDVAGNVTLVTYDTQKEGYTARQEVTLTLKNTGTVPLYGLDIDTVTDAGAADKGGDGGDHFRLLKPLASFLAPGQSTTFTLSYQFELKHKDASAAVLDYIDTLYLTSSSHPNAADPLLAFDAKFRVSDQDIHRVTVKYTPAAGQMGTAGTIMGEIRYSTPAPGDPAYVMDFTPGSYTYTQGEPVYISALPVDEYTIKSITYTYPGMTSTTPEIPDDYTSGDGTAAAEIPDPYLVYSFDMPAADVVVEVVYEESIYSKLRLSAMVDYSAISDTLLKPGVTLPAAENTFQVYQKAFTAKELADAKQFADDSAGNRTAAEYLARVGRADSDSFNPSNDQYLVVIPADAAYSQVEVTLKQVNTLIAGNSNITPVNVTMELLRADLTDAGRDFLDVYPNPNDTPGDTATPTVHYSKSFASPEQGKSAYVRVTTSYKNPKDGITIYRYYYLEIHRKTDEIEAKLKYGNSPYGMILNASNIPGPDATGAGSKKEEALTQFVDNHFSFAGLANEFVPKVVQGKPQAQLHYWSEAWVPQGSLYEPESDTDLGDYHSEKNLDLDPVALFVLSTEGFNEPGIVEIKDSSGRAVDPAKITRYVDVVLLDAAETAQADRFAEPAAGDEDRVGWRIPLGMADQPAVAGGWVQALKRDIDPETGDYRKDADGNYIYVQKKDPATGEPQVDVNGAPVYETQSIQLRPGVYDMVYSFLDYDGKTLLTSVTRPLVILPPVGDVNADGTVDADDERAVKARVTDPPGYSALGYASGNVFRYRSCDTNNDRNINNIDANVLRAYTSGDILRFYLVTGYIG